MADDRMKDDDLKRDMGNGREGQDFGKQTPGRNPQDDRATGGGQQGGQGGKEPRDLEDDEFDGGSTGKGGGQNRGGQDR
jgi:hypothetical protein